jgi:ABC-type lipoprotein release transport system permease subunit
MPFYLKLAGRNLLRNKRRSFMTGVAIGMGLAALIFVDALIIGMERNMIKSATDSFLGEGQIHRQGFRETQDIALTIRQFPEVMDSLQHDPVVANVAPRVIAFGMITSPANVSAISLVGIDPAAERYLSQIDEAMIAGHYLDDESAREIVIGSKLAELLEIGLGDRVVVTATQVTDSTNGSHGGDLAQEMFRISGIYRFNVRELDGSMAFIRLEKAQQMLRLGSAVHQIAIKFLDPEIGRNEAHPFWKNYSHGDNVAVGWTKLLPQLKASFELAGFGIFITGAILFGVVALGIVNTLFMSLHERMFEFGVLRAVGTRPFRMAALIVWEAAALAVLSIGIGIAISVIATFIVAQTGIDYTGVEYAGATFRELLYPVMTFEQYLFYPFWVFVFTTLVGIYPAVHAARMSPAEAMRKSL